MPKIHLKNQCPRPARHKHTHTHTCHCQPFSDCPHTHTQPPIQIHIFTHMPLNHILTPNHPSKYTYSHICHYQPPHIPLEFHCQPLLPQPPYLLCIFTHIPVCQPLLPLISCLLSCPLASCLPFIFFLFGYTSMVFLFSKQYIREIIGESQKIVEQVNSNYNNTSLALSCRHIYSKFINIFSNKNIVLFLTKYRHIH